MITSTIALFNWIIIGLGVYFFCLSVSNAIRLAKESRPAELTDGSFVSVLIPARDEEAHIEQCIQSLMNQTYTNYEVLVLNDNSTDKTGEILDRLQALYPDKLKVFQGAPLQADWSGKPFAMKQLCQQAKGKYWLFTDADTVHSPSSISLAMTNIVYHKVDFINKNHILIIVAVLGIFIFLTLPPFLAAGLAVYTLIGTKTVSFTLVVLWINLILVGGTWAVVFRTNGIDKSIYIRYYLPIYYMLRLSHGFIP